MARYGSVGPVAGTGPYAFVCDDEKNGVVLGDVGVFKGGSLPVGRGSLSVAHGVVVVSGSSSWVGSGASGDQ